MRFLLPAALVATTLAASSGAWAQGSPDAARGAGVRAPSVMRGGGWRCLEEPFSLSVRGFERESARMLAPDSVQSPGTTYRASPRPTPAPVPTPVAAPERPLSPVPIVCNPTVDPGCRVEAPPAAPPRVQLGSAHAGATVAPIPPSVPRFPGLTIFAIVPVHDPVFDAHVRSPWRPPAA